MKLENLITESLQYIDDNYEPTDCIGKLGAQGYDIVAKATDKKYPIYEYDVMFTEVRSLDDKFTISSKGKWSDCVIAEVDTENKRLKVEWVTIKMINGFDYEIEHSGSFKNFSYKDIEHGWYKDMGMGVGDAVEWHNSDRKRAK